METKKEKKTLTVVERIIRDDNIKKTLMRSNRYFDWLSKFTISVGGGFSDDDWLYRPDDLSAIDLKRVSLLQHFCSGLMDYANKYKIPLEEADKFAGEAVNVRYMNNNYKLGYLAGQGVFFYCKRLDDTTRPKNLIDYRDVVLDANQTKQSELNK